MAENSTTSRHPRKYNCTKCFSTWRRSLAAHPSRHSCDKYLGYMKNCHVVLNRINPKYFNCDSLPKNCPKCGYKGKSSEAFVCHSCEKLLRHMKNCTVNLETINPDKYKLHPMTRFLLRMAQCIERANYELSNGRSSNNYKVPDSEVNDPSVSPGLGNSVSSLDVNHPSIHKLTNLKQPDSLPHLNIPQSQDIKYGEFVLSFSRAECSVTCEGLKVTVSSVTDKKQLKNFLKDEFSKNENFYRYLILFVKLFKILETENSIENALNVICYEKFNVQIEYESSLHLYLHYTDEKSVEYLGYTLMVTEIAFCAICEEPFSFSEIIEHLHQGHKKNSIYLSVCN